MADTTEFIMTLWNELLGSDVGRMSLAVIVFMLGMGACYIRYFLRHMEQDGKAHARATTDGHDRP